MDLIESIVAQAPGIAALRRDLHAHPELCFQEKRTADLVATQLEAWGIPVHRGLGTTGVVGIVKAGSSERAIALRADMDALPMQEFNTFAHASQHTGKMRETAGTIVEQNVEAINASVRREAALDHAAVRERINVAAGQQ